MKAQIAALLLLALVAPHSETTAEPPDTRAGTCAHPWLPFGTRMLVCRKDRCTECRVNDRGPVRTPRAWT